MRTALVSFVALAGAVLVPTPVGAQVVPPAPTVPCPTVAPPVGSTVPGDVVGFAQAYTPMLDPIRRVRKDFAAIAATGAKWVRFDLLWSEVQRTGRDEFDWRRSDRAVAAATDAGLQVLATLAYTPKWARPKGGDEKAFAPAHPEDFARFAREAAERYGPRGVHHYEVWNEPNLTFFFRPRSDIGAFVRLLQVAYPAIHEGDPLAVVISGGLAPYGETHVASTRDGIAAPSYLREMYRLGAQGSFDALGFHPYTLSGPPTVTEAYAGFCQTATLHDIMVEHGDGEKPIWGTEAGAPVVRHEQDEATQAEHIREYLTLWEQWPFATGPFFLYTLRDPPESSAFGLQRSDRSPREAYRVLEETVTPGT